MNYQKWAEKSLYFLYKDDYQAGHTALDHSKVSTSLVLKGKFMGVLAIDEEIIIIQAPKAESPEYLETGLQNILSGTTV